MVGNVHALAQLRHRNEGTNQQRDGHYAVIQHTACWLLYAIRGISRSEFCRQLLAIRRRHRALPPLIDHDAIYQWQHRMPSSPRAITRYAYTWWHDLHSRLCDQTRRRPNPTAGHFI